jgi:predicted transcriptional regulator
VTTIADLYLDDGQPIRIRISSDPNATNAGGVNIFGAAFGNHVQDVLVRVDYE